MLALTRMSLSRGGDICQVGEREISGRTRQPGDLHEQAPVTCVLR
jgi:hypothetical protein